MAWLAGCRRLRRRYERKADHFLAFPSIACTLICYRAWLHGPTVSLPAMYRIDEALPSVDEYQGLRASVGWGSPTPTACEIALTATPFGVVARHHEQAVGMARLVGDKTLYLLIVDVAVHPDHRGSGLGRGMVRKLVDWAKEQGTRSTLLVASPEVVPFYKSLDFTIDDNSLMKRTPTRAF
jgi:GNAT superfamily N-acetyltransferase